MNSQLQCFTRGKVQCTLPIIYIIISLASLCSSTNKCFLLFILCYLHYWCNTFTTFIFNEKAGIDIFLFFNVLLFCFLFLGFFHLKELYCSVLFTSKQVMTCPSTGPKKFLHIVEFFKLKKYTRSNCIL